MSLSGRAGRSIARRARTIIPARTAAPSIVSCHGLLCDWGAAVGASVRNIRDPRAEIHLSFARSIPSSATGTVLYICKIVLIRHASGVTGADGFKLALNYRRVDGQRNAPSQ
jgi:hypothetical protein